MTGQLWFPTTAEEAAALAAPAGRELVAGGTDVLDRRRTGVLATDDLVFLRRLSGHADVRDEGAALSVGALVRLRDLASDAALQRHAPLLVDAVAATATPQVRSLATLGGSLFQRPRCPYLRNPDYACAKEGVGPCLARDGEPGRRTLFDGGACVAVHPSTPAAALLALDAQLEVRAGGQTRTVALADVLVADPDDATVEHALPGDALVERVLVPKAAAGSRQRYFRAAARQLAEWADVEVAVSLVRVGERVTSARVVLGAVARTPLRARGAERVLLARAWGAETIAEAARQSAAGARPLAGEEHRVALLEGAVRTALEELS